VLTQSAAAIAAAESTASVTTPLASTHSSTLTAAALATALSTASLATTHATTLATAALPASSAALHHSASVRGAGHQRHARGAAYLAKH